MCHRYNVKTNHYLLGSTMKTSIRAGLDETLFNGDKDHYPLNMALVACLDEQGNRVIEAMQFGLVPHWFEASGNGKAYVRKYSTFNARSETASQKPTFRAAFERRRCLVPVTKFFEPPDNWFSVPDDSLFAMAGIWDCWKGKSETIRSFCILTCEANDLVARHRTGRPRMPVILDTDDRMSAWLNSDVSDGYTLQELLRPARDEMLVRTRTD